MNRQNKDFNYLYCNGYYSFYYINEHGQIEGIGNTTDPLQLIKKLTLEGFRYNPTI